MKKVVIWCSKLIDAGKKALHFTDNEIFIKVLSISLTKSAGTCRFGHTDWKNF